MTRAHLVHKDLMRGFESEAFSGSMVEAMGGELDAARGDGFKDRFHRWYCFRNEKTPGGDEPSRRPLLSAAR